VQERLRIDVARLEPTSRDSSDRAAKKMAEMQREDDLRRKLWGKAIEANRPSVTSSASGTVLQFNINGYRRMVQIHTSGDWR
jgi:hypothetical protein